MAELNIATAILSVSTPGTTFLPKPADAASLARDLNDYSAGLVASSPERFGFFATVPCRTSTKPSPKPCARWTTSTPTGWCCWPTTPGPTSARRARRPVRRARRALRSGVHPSGRTARTGGARCIAMGGGLSARHDSSRILTGAQRHTQQVPEHPVHPRPCRRLRPVRLAPDGHRDHGATPAAVPRTASTTSPASTSTPRCRPARPHCRLCLRSPNRAISLSGPIGRSRQ